jgi:hypothetical protein
MKSKAIFKLIIIILIISCDRTDEVTNLSQNCLTGSLQNGVIAFYPFSSGSINDYSGNNYNLTNPTTASAGTDRAGNASCAFNFNATNGDFLKFINPTFINNFQTIPFSISLWYKNETSSSGNYELLIGRDTNLRCPDTHGQWSVGLYDVRKPVFGINEYSIWWNNSSNVTTSTWRHLVVTCVGTDLKLYLNGVLTSEVANTGCSTSNPTLNIGDLLVGKGYTGLLDDIVIYNRIISQSEINQLYSLTTCCQ